MADSGRKTISVVVPCYNEEGNVREIYARTEEIFRENLPQYSFEVLFIDNDSGDRTREYLREICRESHRAKAIFNAKNFGQFNSPYYAMCQASGDCVILMSCDFQDPPEMIPKFVAEWERGYKIVSGIKAASRENRVMRLLRTCYYKAIKKMSDVEQIEHFTGFGLYDRSFIEVLKALNDPTPFLRGIVAELGFRRKDIPFEQPRRAAGKTHNNWGTLYDAAMLSFTSYTKVGLRIATVIGFAFSGLSMAVALVYLILKLIYWERFVAGTIPVLLAVCILGSVQIFFIGLLGEYILSMNKRIMKRPLVVEEERIGFDEGQEESSRAASHGEKDRPMDREI